MRRKLVTLITVTAAALIAVIGTSGTGQADVLRPVAAAAVPPVQGEPGWSVVTPLEPGWS
ncbi:hypothetical protein AB0953_00160 [Streptomyces sp. NPDC046866]|uniref:hypothetical protein n=1 Tax=Streptomyces sp. NPDC046866 TaxID=3154921 RepID=UPI0034560408